MRLPVPGSEQYRQMQPRRESHDVVPVDEPTPLSYEETEQKFHDLWSSGAKMEAMEVVLGHPVYSDDLENSPELTTAFTQTSADEAFGAALLAKQLEEPEGVEPNQA